MHSTLGDSAAGIWLGELLNNCVREGSGGRVGVDVNLLALMCKNEPKNAQFAMQWLAGELRIHLSGKLVSEASGPALDLRLILGSLFAAYCLAFEAVGHTPPELEFAIQHNPEILESFNFVIGANRSKINAAAGHVRSKKSWWKVW